MLGQGRASYSSDLTPGQLSVPRWKRTSQPKRSTDTWCSWGPMRYCNSVRSQRRNAQEALIKAYNRFALDPETQDKVTIIKLESPKPIKYQLTVAKLPLAKDMR
jgi:hypothetical protein